MFAIQSRRAYAGLLSAALTLSLISCAGTAQDSAPKTPAEASTPQKDASSLGTLAEGEPMTNVPVEADDAALGSSTAPVTVIAFLDFECSFCAQGFSVLRQLQAHYGSDEVRIVFKHLPLDFHALALPAAVAGQTVKLEAGDAAFFRFAELAFEGQAHLGFSELAGWAEEAGVPRDVYNEAAGSELMVRRVATDVLLARKLGVDGTPAFFVNGRMIAGAQPIDAFHQLIAEEREKMAGVTKETWRTAYTVRVRENAGGSILTALLAEDPGLYKVPVDGSAIDGQVDAPVTLVTFTDFECPYCKRADVTIQALQRQYPNDLRVVFKHLPLGFHAHARAAARLVEAVRVKSGDEGFFRASARLFELSPALDDNSLNAVAQEFGLDKATWEAARNGKNAAIEERLQKDQTLADDVLARGTPHFFINGRRLNGAKPFEHFDALIVHERNHAQELLQAGTPPAKLYQEVQRDAVQPGAPQKLEQVISESGRPTHGPKNAPVTIHVFSDFECPYCRTAEATLAALSRAYPEKIRYVWHDFPLPFHEHARGVSRVGREAYRVGGSALFFKFHDAVFAQEGDGARVSESEILNIARALGLAEARVKAALAESAEGSPDDAFIDADIALGEGLGIRGTPAFVVGGYLVTGARPLSHFQRIVELSLGENTSAPD